MRCLSIHLLTWRGTVAALIFLLAAVVTFGGDQNDSWHRGVQRFRTSKDWPGMVTYTTRWTQAKPQEPDAWCLLGFANGKLRQWMPMRQAYDRCLAIVPHEEHSWTLAASSYFDAWKFGSAIGVLKDGVAKNPNSSWIWENLGFDYGDLADAQMVQHSKIGDTDGLQPGQNLDLARQAFAKALALGSKGQMDMWAQLGQWEVDAGQDYAAMLEFFHILKNRPGDRSALHGLAVANGYLKGQCITHKERPSSDPKYVIVGPPIWTCSVEMQKASEQATAMTR